MDTLGCGLIERTPFACRDERRRTELRITLVDNFEPQPFAVLGFEVGDVPAEVAALREKGVEFLEISGIDRTRITIYHVPGGGEVAWFLDPDGNTLTLAADGRLDVPLRDREGLAFVDAAEEIDVQQDHRQLPERYALLVAVGAAGRLRRRRRSSADPVRRRR